MLREGYSFVLEAPWLALAAGSAIFLIALASQSVADGLQLLLARRGARAPATGRAPASTSAVSQRPRLGPGRPVGSGPSR
jgi:hypothetical protein